MDLDDVVDPQHRLDVEDAPIQPDQEWANAVTHWIAAVLGLVGAWVMGLGSQGKPAGLIISCLAFVFSAIAVFVASAMSHTFIHDAKKLHRFRAWDQGLIYAMISGTYTPLLYQFSAPTLQAGSLVAVWVAAAVGFYSKVFATHRVNSIGTATYLMLGWFPALVLVGRVPFAVLCGMTVGGLLYTVGVIVLMNDTRLRYMHALWHLLVMTAAGTHFWTIYWYVAQADLNQ